MIRALIIDDEPNNTELVSNLLKLFCPDVELIGIAHSVASGFESIQKLKPDLLFLDIRLGDGTAFDLLARFDQINFKVIFITAHSEFALEAFRLAALDYLLKPVSPANLIEAVSRAKEALTDEDLNGRIQKLLSLHQVRSPENHITIRTHDRIYHLPPLDIIRLEADGNYCTVFLNNGDKIVVSKLIKEFEQLLENDNFLRVHQSHLVNLHYLYFFEKNDSTLMLKDRTQIPVSMRKKDILLAHFSKG